jgi:hypothetical protein
MAKEQEFLMKEIIGCVLFIAGIVLGLYVGLYLMFVCGIIDVVNAVTGDVIDAWRAAWGVVKVVFAGFVGWIIFFICSALAVAVNSR